MTNTEYEALQEEVTEIKLREALERAGVDSNVAKVLSVGMTCQDGKLMRMGMDRWLNLEWQAQKAELERQQQEKRKQEQKATDQGTADLEKQVAAAMGLSEPEQEPEDLFLKGFNNGY